MYSGKSLAMNLCRKLKNKHIEASEYQKLSKHMHLSLIDNKFLVSIKIDVFHCHIIQM